MKPFVCMWNGHLLKRKILEFLDFLLGRTSQSSGIVPSASSPVMADASVVVRTLCGEVNYSMSGSSNPDKPSVL